MSFHCWLLALDAVPKNKYSDLRFSLFEDSLGRDFVKKTARLCLNNQTYDSTY